MAVTRKFRVHLGYEVPNLPNRQWNCIKDLIPPAKTGGRPRTVAPRQVINAIFSIVVSGIQWRMLPKDYPRWKTVYYYFRIWRDDGTWQRIHDTLRAAVRRKAGRHTHPTAGCLDSQSVKSTQIPAIRGHDAGKKVTGRKRHILVDTMGLLIIVVVTAASVSDPAGARLLFSRLGGAGKKLRRIWVDGTYRGKLVDWVWTHCRVILQPVLRSDDMKGFVVLPRRWVVERTFAWLTQCRRLCREYEVLPASSEAMMYLAMTRLMVRRLAACPCSDVHAVVSIRFATVDCRACPVRSKWGASTRSRSLTIRSHDASVALQTARQRQHTEGFKATYRPRAGIEGPIAQGTRSSDLCRSRYVGFVKTRLLHLLIGAAMNFMRLAAWLADVPHAQTRRSAFAKLVPVPT